jgi:hypothetical protein
VTLRSGQGVLALACAVLLAACGATNNIVFVPDAGPSADAGSADAGTHDAGTDAGTHDAGTDAGTHDAGTDAGTHDAGTDGGADAGPQDAGGVTHFLLGGMLSGLAGNGLVLQNEGADDLAVSSNGPFAFAPTYPLGAVYAVTVKTQPVSPYQTCTVSQGSGVVQGSDLSSVIVNCAASPLYNVGGTVSGLSGSGLVLQDDGFDDLQIAGNGNFVFPMQLQEGVPYQATVKTSPVNPLQTCTVTSGGGVVGPADVSSIAIRCATNPSFTIGGTVNGLTGAGLKLQDNASDDLAVTKSGNFVFARGVQGTLGYRVTVSAQPSGQSCAVTAGGEGIVGTATISSVVVTCASARFIPISVQISGVAGTGLSLENGTDVLPIATDGTLTFANQLQSGQSYAVTVFTQPVSPRQTCAVSGSGSGVASASTPISIAIRCTTNPSFTIGGTVTGLAGSGLVLLDNGGDLLAISANGTFTFPTALQSGDSYSVASSQEPSTPFQTCAVTNGSGVVQGAAINNLQVACSTSSYYVLVGRVTGLSGNSVVLQNNFSNDTTVSASGGFIFTALLQAGQAYSVTVKTQPANPSLTCVVTGGAGIVDPNSSPDITVTCNPATAFTVGGVVTGLDGSGLVLVNNGVDPLTVSQSGAFTFAAHRLPGTDFNITVKTQPLNPAQTCSIQSASGVVSSANITGVQVVCLTRSFTVGGTVTGLPAGSNVTLADNVTDLRAVTGAGDGSAPIAFTFGVAIPSGRSYSATVSATTGPVSCSVSSGSGAVSGAGGNVTSIAVNCVPAFLISGTVSAVNGTGLQLKNSTTGEVLAIAKSATTFAFTRAVTQAQGYAISVVAQPLTIAQTCSYTAGTTAQSDNPSAAVTGIGFNCVVNAYPVGGLITGLPASATVTLLDNNADSTLVYGAGDGSVPVQFNFLTPVNSGAAWSAKLSTSTSNVSCAITANAAGTVANAAPTGILVACLPTFTIGGTIAGYTGTGLQLVLKNSAGATLQTTSPASLAAAFAFTTPVTQAAGYLLAITQPTSTPTQRCSFSPAGTAAAGNPTANVTGIVLNCAAGSFTIGGAITGLPTGSSVVLVNSSFDRLTVAGTAAGNPSFTFAVPVPGGQAYSATVSGFSGPVTCAIASGASGTAAANVTSIAVVCTPGFMLAGTIAGYTGTGLQLTNTVTAETITVAKGATAFAFTKVAGNLRGYSIVVQTPPNSPSQLCAFGGTGSPLIGNPTGSVGDISIACSVNAFTIGGVINGLPSGGAVKLLNASDSVMINGASDGTAPLPFAFDIPVNSGATYAATIPGTTGPVTCAFATGAAGTVGIANVTNMVINCVPGFFVSGTLALYAGAGLQMKNSTTGELQNVAAGQTTFAFAVPFSAAAGYNLSASVQPTNPLQSCALNPDSLSLLTAKPTANVNNVQLICTTTLLRLGGTVTGLAAGATVRLQDNGFDQITVTGTGDGSAPIAFNFNTSLSSGATYLANVVSTTGTVACAITNPSGTLGNTALTAMQVICAPSFTLAGTISNYQGSALQLNNTTTNEAITVGPGKTAFAFTVPVSQANGYSIGVLNNPVNPVQSCSVAAGAGHPAANITNLAVTCVSSSFSIGGAVTGLTGTGLVLEDNGGDDLAFGVQSPTYPAFTFPSLIASGKTYSVSVRQQPTGQICTPREGTAIGMVNAGPIHNVHIDCTAQHHLGGLVTNYLGSGLVISDGIENLAVASNRGNDVAFTFNRPLGAGAAYFTTIANQPGSPVQTCFAEGGNGGFNDGSGAVGNSDDATLLIACSVPSYPIGGTIEGAANGTSDAIALLNNGGEQVVLSLSPTSTGNIASFTFNTPIGQGLPYSVTVQQPPSNLVCSVKNGTGIVGSGPVTDVQIFCGYPISGTFDTGVLNGISGIPPEFVLTASKSTTPGPGSDAYTDTDQVTISSTATTFALKTPMPYGRLCALSLTGPVSNGDSRCFIESYAGCNGVNPVTGPVAPVLRCQASPAIALIPFSGATGRSYAVGVNGTGAVNAALNFTGTTDLGHGARVASTFKAGTNNVTGTAGLMGLDSNGYRAAIATPLTASWDQLIPTLAAKVNTGAAKVRALAENSNGDLVVGGSFIGSVDFGDGNGAFNAGAVESMFLARYNSLGGLVWIHPFGAGAIASVAFNGAQIVAGGVFGAVNSTETFSSKTGTATAACATMTAATAHRDFVAAFDLAAGGCVYSVNVGTGNDPNALPARLGPAVALDSASNLIAGGNALDANDPTRLAGPYLLAYSATGALRCMAGNTGNEIYKDATTPANDQLNGLALGLNDTVYVTGSCQGAPKQQGVTLTSCNPSTPSAFIAQYAAVASCNGTNLVGTLASGAVLNRNASTGSSIGLALASDLSGNLYMAGDYTGAPAFSGAPLTSSASALTTNIFLARFPSTLTTPSLQALTGSGNLSVTGVAAGADGSAWVSGAYNGTVTYKGGASPITLGTTSANPEPMLVQFPQVAP